jgi:hypothetical protein
MIMLAVIYLDLTRFDNVSIELTKFSPIVKYPPLSGYPSKLP